MLCLDEGPIRKRGDTPFEILRVGTGTAHTGMQGEEKHSGEPISPGQVPDKLDPLIQIAITGIQRFCLAQARTFRKACCQLMETNQERYKCLTTFSSARTP